MTVVGEGVCNTWQRNGAVEGDTARSSKMDNGEAGRSGEAMGNNAWGLNARFEGGGERKGLRGERGAVCGEGVSRFQYDSGGMGGALGDGSPSKGVEMVPGSGNVARRGVGGRGARHGAVEGMGMVSELGRWLVGVMAGEAGWVGAMFATKK